MAEFDPPKVEYKLIIDDKYHNTLNIEGFSYMMRDPAYCYKYFWIEAIIKLITEGTVKCTFDSIINEMICNAWYSVLEYHIHLSGIQADGQVRDGLERAILKLSELSNLPANASKVEILNSIKAHEADLKQAKDQLTNMVPYRALSGFFPKDDLTEADWNSPRRMTAYIERFNRDVEILPYTLGNSSKLKKEVFFNPAWIKMIQDNTVSIFGWIQYEKIKWLQNNNPEVPGLVYKLSSDEKVRKLNSVRRLWESIIPLCEVKDVFTGKVVVSNNYDVDHFIPWSFVMNDELWNLMPMDSSLNSAKRNRLPKWDPFFNKFAENQYIMYRFIHENKEIHKRYEACYRDNLHSIWAGQELYRKGNSKEEFYNILQKNMRPVYDSARRQGYEIWNR